MSKLRWRGSQPVEEDVARGLAAFEDDLGLRARVVVEAGPRTETLDISVLCYRLTGDVRLGVARHNALWVPGDRSAYGKILLGIHHSYQEAYEKAFTTDYPHKKRSVG